MFPPYAAVIASADFTYTPNIIYIIHMDDLGYWRYWLFRTGILRIPERQYTDASYLEKCIREKHDVAAQHPDIVEPLDN